MIAYGRQSIDSEDIVAVVDVLSGNYLTTGPKVGEFEQALAEKCGVKYAVALSNGTAALHIGAKTILNSGDKVLTTPISFVATSNSILYADATPIFVDVDDGANIDLNLCEDALKKDGSVKAIFAVDFTGRCVDPDGLRFLKDKYGIKILEDAAHSLGSTHLAKGSDLATLSFHPVKHITTGEGGAILTNDEEIYKRSKLLRGHGITREPSEFVLADEAFGEDGLPNPWYYEMSDLGFNYRITDFQCALGISQLSKLDKFINRRKEIAATYDEKLKEHPLISPLYRFDFDSAYHLYVAMIDYKGAGVSRKELFGRLNSKKIFPQVHYIPINMQPYYRGLGYDPCDTPKALEYYRRCISLPIYPDLTDDLQDYVLSCLFGALK